MKQNQTNSDPIVSIALPFHFSFKNSKACSREQQLLCFDGECPQTSVNLQFSQATTLYGFQELQSARLTTQPVVNFSCEDNVLLQHLSPGSF